MSSTSTPGPAPQYGPRQTRLSHSSVSFLSFNVCSSAAFSSEASCISPAPFPNAFCFFFFPSSLSFDFEVSEVGDDRKFPEVNCLYLFVFRALMLDGLLAEHQ
ncbi:hypothetical protein V6N11_050829 [Hibiscus sabdariffa]|uniref:Uncharacterized protein n=1 Tax=Hibiscus sabdariffa TaxID=183260 RepID=A0ABR2TBR1_9ROSI